MKLTIKDIARLSGVSPTTVSKVMNSKDDDIGEATKQRVKEIISEHGYTPNIVARSMVTKKTNTIGIVIPDIRNPFFPELIRGAEDTAHDLGYNLIICNTDDDADKEKIYLDILKKKMVDGIIFTASSSQSFHQTNGFEMPTVVVDRDIKTRNIIGRIIVDNIKGGYLAAEHLLERGCRKIGFISGVRTSLPSLERFIGYKRALENNGITDYEEICRFKSFKSEFGYTAAKELLEDHPDIDGLFCASDLIAIGAIQAAVEKGMRIPEDIKIVGFDDIYISKYLNPPLTTIRQPVYQIGEIAAKMLIESFKSKRHYQDEENFEVLDTQLIIRKST